MRRLLKHLLCPDWVVRSSFPPSTLARIEQEIGKSEQRHRAELRFALEAGLPLGALLKETTPRERAQAAFGDLRVWDTEENSGVLIYVQLVDRDIEIVADRGIAAKVAQGEWETICQAMEAAFRERRFEEGALQAIRRVGDLLAQYFPATGSNANELPDKPAVL
jgi:TPM domain